jgi:hypothetical protein
VKVPTKKALDGKAVQNVDREVRTQITKEPHPVSFQASGTLNPDHKGRLVGAN